MFDITSFSHGLSKCIAERQLKVKETDGQWLRGWGCWVYGSFPKMVDTPKPEVSILKNGLIVDDLGVPPSLGNLQ